MGAFDMIPKLSFVAVRRARKPCQRRKINRMQISSAKKKKKKKEPHNVEMSRVIEQKVFVIGFSSRLTQMAAFVPPHQLVKLFLFSLFLSPFFQL